MSSQEEEFVGHLMTFDKKGEGDQIIDENVLVEVTEFREDGLVELAFTDRNERCYLQINMADLMRRIARRNGAKLSG